MYGNTRDEKIVPWKRFLVETVTKFANIHNIKVTLLSGDWIIVLEKDSVLRHIFGLDFGLNNSTAKLFARDKVATSDMLQHYEVPCVPHHLFLRPASQGANPNGNWEAISALFQKYNADVVCKPNNGGGGANVTRVQTQDELEITIQNLFIEDRAIAISPFVNIKKEYRATILKNEVELVYEKKRLNENDFKFNLSSGASAIPITDKNLENSIKTLAINAAEAIGITFANIDIIESEKGLEILEINSGVMFENYAKQGQKEKDRAELIYFKAIESLFN